MPKTVICRDVYGNETVVPRENLSFRPSVYGVTLRDGKVLLARQLGGYAFPGGGIELGERFDEALEREVREETGVTVERDVLLHVQDDFFTHPVTKKNCHSLLFYYRCKYIQGDVSTEWFHENDKLLDGRLAEWVPVEKIPSLKFFNPVDSAAVVRQAFEL